MPGKWDFRHEMVRKQGFSLTVLPIPGRADGSWRGKFNKKYNHRLHFLKEMQS
jgi:hypothetical protein